MIAVRQHAEPLRWTQCGIRTRDKIKGGRVIKRGVCKRETAMRVEVQEVVVGGWKPNKSR
jgi:hypothetical protein